MSTKENWVNTTRDKTYQFLYWPIYTKHLLINIKKWTITLLDELNVSITSHHLGTDMFFKHKSYHFEEWTA